MSGVHQMLLGSGGGTILPLASVTTTGNVISGGESNATYGFINFDNFNGTVYKDNLGSLVYIGNWISRASSNFGLYETRGTWTQISGSGDTFGPTTYTTMPVFGSLGWRLRTINSDATYELFVEIRAVGSGTVLSSATITFETFGAP